MDIPRFWGRVCMVLQTVQFAVFFYFTNTFSGRSCRVYLMWTSFLLQLLAAPHLPGAQRALRTALLPRWGGGSNAEVAPAASSVAAPRGSALGGAAGGGGAAAAAAFPSRSGAVRCLPLVLLPPPSASPTPGLLPRRRRPGHPGRAEPGLASSGTVPAKRPGTAVYFTRLPAGAAPSAGSRLRAPQQYRSGGHSGSRCDGTAWPGGVVGRGTHPGAAAVGNLKRVDTVRVEVFLPRRLSVTRVCKREL